MMRKKSSFCNRSTCFKKFFYDKIGIYQILLLGEKNEYVETFIYDQLGPVLEYDAKMNASLLTTLEVYLKNRGRKKETANELFIVRQTLYHRLEKIEELLGYQFMEPARRLALETAILAYHIYQSGHTHFNLEDYQL
jgi:DNA-binding PucR family transcriptional regulator